MHLRGVPLQPLEIEVKFYPTDIDPVRNSIIELGADCLGRVFETNIRFEDANKNLIKKGSLLRLRKDKKTRLTFKSKPHDKDRQFKIFRELEVTVSDFSTMNMILESLGYYKEQIYEKWRETFVLDRIEFCIDTMPFGNFLEIEGEKEKIKPLADRIGLKWEKRIILSYLDLFNIIKDELNLTFSDVTFSNFKDVKVDFGKYADLFEAGLIV